MAWDAWWSHGWMGATGTRQKRAASISPAYLCIQGSLLITAKRLGRIGGFKHILVNAAESGLAGGRKGQWHYGVIFLVPTRVISPSEIWIRAESGARPRMNGRSMPAPTTEAASRWGITAGFISYGLPTEVSVRGCSTNTSMRA